MKDINHFAYNNRGLLVGLPVIAALVFPIFKPSNDTVVWTIAVIMFSMGLFIRIWAQQHLHFRLKMKRICTTTGPYSFVRNPIYIGNSLICLALVTATEQLWLLPVQLLFCCIVFTFVVRYEERFLLEKYGTEYAEYLKQVPRWFPKYRIISQSIFSGDYLGISIKAELYNFLFFIPVIIKEVITG
ncbi:MAG: methyltransferase family protein [Armatimonadota bacterium]